MIAVSVTMQFYQRSSKRQLSLAHNMAKQTTGSQGITDIHKQAIGIHISTPIRGTLAFLKVTFLTSSQTPFKSHMFPLQRMVPKSE